MTIRHGNACLALVWLLIEQSSPVAAGALSSPNFMVPSKDVALTCPPLRHVIHCSISRMANPEYSSYCFYVAGGRSWPMKTDYRFGFYNDVVRVHVRDGLRITAQLTDLRSGARARCSE